MRDTLARALYGALFDWIVEQVWLLQTRNIVTTCISAKTSVPPPLSVLPLSSFLPHFPLSFSLSLLLPHFLPPPLVCLPNLSFIFLFSSFSHPFSLPHPFLSCLLPHSLLPSPPSPSFLQVNVTLAASGVQVSHKVDHQLCPHAIRYSQLSRSLTFAHFFISG